MEFSWTKALWKAFRSAVLAAFSVAVAAGTVDIFFDKLSADVGSIVPVWSIPVLAAVLTVGRNFLKQWARSEK